MKITEYDVINFFYKYRALDGYIGIFKFVTHYKILATYHNWLYIFSLSSRELFTVSLIYHEKRSKYPRLHFILRVGKWDIFDNGKSAAEYYATSCNNYMENKKQEKETVKNQLQKAKDAVEEATFGKVECGVALETIRENLDGVELE